MKAALLASFLVLSPTFQVGAQNLNCNLCDLQIVDVREHREVLRYGKIDQRRMAGAVLRIVPKLGLTAPWLLHQLKQKSASLTAKGECPLELATRVDVRERGAFFEVRLLAPDVGTARKLLQRASMLVAY